MDLADVDGDDAGDVLDDGGEFLGSYALAEGSVGKAVGACESLADLGLDGCCIIGGVVGKGGGEAEEGFLRKLTT